MAFLNGFSKRILWLIDFGLSIPGSQIIPLFLKVNPPKTRPFHSNQNSRGPIKVFPSGEYLRSRGVETTHDENFDDPNGCKNTATKTMHYQNHHR